MSGPERKIPEISYEQAAHVWLLGVRSTRPYPPELAREDRDLWQPPPYVAPGIVRKTAAALRIIERSDDRRLELVDRLNQLLTVGLSLRVGRRLREGFELEFYERLVSLDAKPSRVAVCRSCAYVFDTKWATKCPRCHRQSAPHLRRHVQCIECHRGFIAHSDPRRKLCDVCRSPVIRTARSRRSNTGS